MSDDLYQAAIVEAARALSRYPRLEAPHASATVDNPLCGDRVTIDLHCGSGTVSAVGALVRGCLLCEAAGALIAEHAPGHGPAELRALGPRVREMLRAGADAPGGSWAALGTFAPVRPYKSRHDCVLLPFEALVKALDALPG